MDWQVLAVAILATSLAGCAATPSGPPTLTALEALERAKAAKPELDLFSLRGLEGQRPGPRSDFLGLTDDGLPDGAMGDGRLSSWVASFVMDDGLLEVQVFADGRDPAIRHNEVPYVTLDERVFLEPRFDVVDSDGAARAASVDSMFAAHASAFPGAGFLYTYARNNIDYAYASDEQNDRIDFVGWPTHNNTWSITHFALDGADPLAQATVDREGVLLEVVHDTPMHEAPLIDEQRFLPSPTPPSLVAPVHFANFTVPRGALDLIGEARVSPDFADEYRVRVLAPDGSIVYDSADEPSTFGAFAASAPTAGTWTVEATQVLPLPDVPPVVVVRFDRRLTAIAQADVPLLALEP